MEIERETNKKKMYRAWVLGQPTVYLPIWFRIRFFFVLHPAFLSSLFFSSAHLPSVTLMVIYNQLFVKQNFNSKFIFSVELRWKRFFVLLLLLLQLIYAITYYWLAQMVLQVLSQMFYRFSKSITHNLYFHEVYVSIRLQIWQKITEGAVSKDVKWKRKQKIEENKKKNRTHANDVVVVQNFKISYTVHGTRVSKAFRFNTRSCNNAYDVR